MQLDDVVISRAIVEDFTREFLRSLETQVAIAGAGPSGLTAGLYLAKRKVKTVIFEKNLKVGGGMPGGGMMFNRIVVQTPATGILDEMGVKYKKYKEGYYLANSLETVAALTQQVIRKGVKIFNLISIEDVMIKNKKVCGLVINWETILSTRLPVDPLTMRCQAVIDATGHDCAVVKKLQQRDEVRLNTPTGKILGEGPMWAEKGENAVLENTREVYPGLYVTGMAANAVYGAPRMGPIFGGMLLSGKRVAELVLKDL